MACHSCPARPRRRERRLAIIPATLAVTAGPDQWKACGNSDPAFAFLASGWKFTDDATLDGNYTIALGGAGQFEIAPRPLAVTADSFSRACGIANPPLIWTVDGDGLVNGDALSGALATAATADSAAGFYPITQGSLSAGGNYAMTFLDGLLTVTAIDGDTTDIHPLLPDSGGDHQGNDNHQGNQDGSGGAGNPGWEPPPGSANLPDGYRPGDDDSQGGNSQGGNSQGGGNQAAGDQDEDDQDEDDENGDSQGGDDQDRGNQGGGQQQGGNKQGGNSQ